MPVTGHPVRWTIVIAVISGCLIAVLGFGIRSGFGLFLAPMSADLGWNREVFALAIAIQNLLWGAGQPVAGAIADRYGVGRVLAAGGVMYALGVYIMSQASSPTELYLSAGVLAGMGIAASSFSLALAAIARMVPERMRLMSMALVTASGSLGQFIMVPLGQAFLDAYGWSFALVLFSALALLVIPLAVPLRGSGSGGGPEQTMGAALREAGSHSGYLYLTAGFFVCGFHVAFIQVHLPAYVTDMGLDATIGAWALALVGFCNIIGSLASGYLGGRYTKKYLLSAIYLARAVVITLFLVVPISPASVLMFAAAMGFLWLSTVPPTSAIVAQIFGPRYMATLFGIVFFSHQLGAFIGVWLGGYLFDVTGSYEIVWWAGVGLGLFAALVHLPIDDRPAVRLAPADG